MSPGPDTIAAIATPPGRGAVAIVRVSGPGVRHIAEALLGLRLSPRSACLAQARDMHGHSIDSGLALYFPAPRSFTGEDVLEFQGHGGTLVADLVLRRILELGARPARPGEFTERAFLNDKMDLAQAEAVADLIDSQTAAAARCALRSLQGVFSDRVGTLLESLIGLRTYVEAALDFPEEEVDFLADESLGRRLEDIAVDLVAVRDAARQGSLLRDGMQLVIAGRPNVGKSTLLNRLAGREAAIVSDIPGTTRDVLRAEIDLDGMPVHVIDTAGLRGTDDPVEREGVRRAWSEVAQADLILWVVDAVSGIGEEDRGLERELPPGVPRLTLWNKCDRVPATAPGGVAVSARTGEGLEILKCRIRERMGYQGDNDGLYMARRRHLDALDRAERHLGSARELLSGTRAGELVAEELRAAQQALGAITGEFTADDLLGRIFSSFCIGK